jgi:hypothetical protein
MTAMQLLVVPKSIPKTFAITFSPSEATDSLLCHIASLSSLPLHMQLACQNRKQQK